jgi:hypothetical protein
MAVRLGLIMPSMISRGRTWLYSLGVFRLADGLSCTGGLHLILDA